MRHATPIRYLTILLILRVWPTPLALPGFATTNRDRQECVGSDADTTIAGCTRIIDSEKS